MLNDEVDQIAIGKIWRFDGERRRRRDRTSDTTRFEGEEKVYEWRLIVIAADFDGGGISEGGGGEKALFSRVARVSR